MPCNSIMVSLEYPGCRSLQVVNEFVGQVQGTFSSVSQVLACNPSTTSNGQSKSGLLREIELVKGGGEPANYDGFGEPTRVILKLVRKGVGQHFEMTQVSGPKCEPKMP